VGMRSETVLDAHPLIFLVLVRPLDSVALSVCTPSVVLNVRATFEFDG
jgi:hypothetical protein